MSGSLREIEALHGTFINAECAFGISALFHIEDMFRLGPVVESYGVIGAGLLTQRVRAMKTSLLDNQRRTVN